jgi:hypothetical protein
VWEESSLNRALEKGKTAMGLQRRGNILQEVASRKHRIKIPLFSTSCCLASFPFSEALLRELPPSHASFWCAV